MKQQLATMLQLQGEMNTKVHSQWQEQEFEWYRAIWVECAELLDHYGWKWWKKQTPDQEQVILELIDIWHFGLSIKLVEGVTPEALTQAFSESLASTTASSDFKNSVEKFSQITLTSKSFDIPAFVQMMKDIDLDFDHLYQQYVGKNVLNFFRPVSYTHLTLPTTPYV